MKHRLFGLVALLFILCAITSAYAQGIEWQKLHDKVMSLLQQGQYDQGVVVAKKALQVAEQTVGPEHPNVAVSLISAMASY
jgi:hypothetical protein